MASALRRGFGLPPELDWMRRKQTQEAAIDAFLLTSSRLVDMLSFLPLRTQQCREKAGVEMQNLGLFSFFFVTSDVNLALGLAVKAKGFDFVFSSASYCPLTYFECHLPIAELKKEELISGLLFPPPRPPSIPLSTGHHAIHNKCTFKTDNRRLSVSSAAETCDSNQYFDAGDRSMVEPNISSNGNEPGHHCISDYVRGADHISISHQVRTVTETSKTLSKAYPLQPIPNSSFNDNMLGQRILNGVPMVNPVSSSPICMDAEISGTYFKHDQLLHKMPFNDSELPVCTDAKTSMTYFNQDQLPAKMPFSGSELGQQCALNGVSELNTISDSPHVRMDEKITETFSQTDRSLLRFQRSRSRQKAIEVRNSGKAKTKSHSFRENISTEYTGKLTHSRPSWKSNFNLASLELKSFSVPPGSAGQLCRADESMNPEETSNQGGENQEQMEAYGDGAILSDYAGNEAIQSVDVANNFYQQACTAEITETQFLSRAPYAIQSICCELKMASTNNEVGLESVLPEPTSDTDTFIEPKQLVFDHIEDYSVKPAVNTPSEENQETSLELRAVSNVATFQSSKEASVTKDFQRPIGISSDQLMQCGDLLQGNVLVKEKEIMQEDEPVSEKVLQNIEILNGEKEAEKILVAGEGDSNLQSLETDEADYNVYRGSPPCQTSDLSALSLKKRMPLCTKKVSGDALGSLSPTSNGMPSNLDKVAISPLQEGGGKNPSRSQLWRAAGFKEPELVSEFLPGPSLGEFSVTTGLQKVTNAHSVVHDTDLSLSDKLVRGKEAPQTDNLMHEKGAQAQQYTAIPNSEEQRQETLNEDQKERLEILQSQEAKCNAFHACTASNLSTSQEKRISTSNGKVCGHASADLSPARNEISDCKAQTSIHNESFSTEDGRKNSQRNELPGAVDFDLPLAPIRTQSICVSDLKCTAELVVEPSKTLIEGCGVEGAANDVPLTSMSIEFSRNSTKPGTHLEASDGGVSSVANGSESSIVMQNISPKGAELPAQQGRYFLRSSNICGRKSGRLSKPVHTSCETSWPTYKVRQIDCLSDALNTSMRTRRSAPFLQQLDNAFRQSKNSVDASLVIHDSVEQPNVATENHAAEMHQSKKRRMTKMTPQLHLQYSTLEFDEVGVEMKGKDQSEMVPIDSKSTNEIAVRRSEVEDSACCLEDRGKMTKPSSLFDAEEQSISIEMFKESVRHESSGIDFVTETTEKLKSIVGQPSSSPSSCSSSYYEGPELLGSDKALEELESISGLLRQEDKQVPDSIDRTMEEVKAALGENSLLSSYSASSSYYENLDLLGDDKTMPESGKSIISIPPHLLTFSVCKRFDFHDLQYSSITKERVTASEQLGKNCSVLTPVVHPTNHRQLTLPEVCQSVPNGLLENADLRKACAFDWNGSEQSKDSQDNNEAERCGYATGRSLSDFIPSSISQSGCGSKGTPYSPPPGKLCWSSSLEKQANQNPELTCFRIDEDTCMNEENAHLEDAVDPFQEISSRKGNIRSMREALSDVSSKYQNSPQVVSTFKNFPDKDSLNSMSVETYLFETQKDGKTNLESGLGNHRKCENEDKENQRLSIVRNQGITLENPNNRFSKPQLSRKLSRKKGSQTFSEKRCKPANIVSNISSFLPLVQHKQETVTALAGKRDIKVKALEAAEAAKRLEEEREKQRKLRKEAAKLERTKLEHVRQLELKKKEEERKKKEEEMAARKRVREEDDRKEKERKRKCIEEARRQQKEREEKLRAEKEEKELRRKVDEERKRELAEEAKKLQKKEKGKGRAGCVKKLEAEGKPANDVMRNASHGSNSQEDPMVLKEPQHTRKDEEYKRELAEEARKQQGKQTGKEGASYLKKMGAEVKPTNYVMGNASDVCNSQEDTEVCKEPHHIGKLQENSVKLPLDHVQCTRAACLMSGADYLFQVMYVALLPDELLGCSNACSEDPAILDNLSVHVFDNSGNSLKLNEDHISVVEESKVSESYAISPYQGSDNEEDEDDDADISEKKFIPFWARQLKQTGIDAPHSEEGAMNGFSHHKLLGNTKIVFFSYLHYLSSSYQVYMTWFLPSPASHFLRAVDFVPQLLNRTNFPVFRKARKIDIGINQLVETRYKNGLNLGMKKPRRNLGKIKSQDEVTYPGVDVLPYHWNRYKRIPGRA
ncbi:hypothetical protein ACLOJK_041710 [Asimina triloba]